MSPHGKPAGGQAQGQPRPPASTPRAPDRAAAPGSRELRRRAQPAGRGHPRAQPPGAPHPPHESSTDRRPARLPSLCPRGSGAPGRPPSGCSYTTAAATPALPRPGRDAARGRGSGRSVGGLCAAGRPRPGARCARRAGQDLGGAVCGLRAELGGRGGRPRRCPRSAAFTRVAEPPRGARCRETGDTQHRFCSRVDGSLWEGGSLGQLCRGHWLVEKK